jgi:uncharacterized protein
MNTDIRRNCTRRLAWFALAFAVAALQCERVDNLVRLEEAVNDKEAYAKRVESECNAGRAASCTSLGVHYAFGTYGRTRDYAVAQQILTKACDLNDPNGCHELGVLHQYGRGTAKSPARAQGFYERACSQGVANSCHNLSDLYRRGTDGIAKDDAKALEYNTKSCAAGYASDCEGGK